MQFLKPSAIFFASIAVAVAEHQHGMQHFHRRQMNSTSSDISTTLTVYQTVVHTITSCAPTITNCPARSSAGAGVITDVIVLTTTICPVSAAESVASSIISAAGGSSNAFTGTPASSTLNTPLGTGLAGGGGQGVSGTSGGIGDSSASGTILTYMLGAGSSTTIATTTLKHTSTATAYVTQYVTRSHSAAAIATGGAAVTQGGAPGTQIGAAVTQTGATGAASQAEQTTTITSSSTMTEYITVMLAPSSSGLPANGVTGGSSTGGNGIGSGNGGESGIGSGSCDCATVAPVTVTVALATVTVVSYPYDLYVLKCKLTPNRPTVQWLPRPVLLHLLQPPLVRLKLQLQAL